MQVCNSLQTVNHASTSLLSFLQAGCPSCRPANSVKALNCSANDAKNLVQEKKEENRAILSEKLTKLARHIE